MLVLLLYLHVEKPNYRLWNSEFQLENLDQCVVLNIMACDKRDNLINNSFQQKLWMFTKTYIVGIY